MACSSSKGNSKTDTCAACNCWVKPAARSLGRVLINNISVNRVLSATRQHLDQASLLPASHPIALHLPFFQCAVHEVKPFHRHYQHDLRLKSHPLGAWHSRQSATDNRLLNMHYRHV